MNKKGVDYAALMVIVVIIAVGTLYMQITKKTASFEREIGETQAPILALNSETVLYEMYVREAAKLAETCDEKELNLQLNKKLEIYEKEKGWKIPKDNFAIAISEGKIFGAALLPTEIPLKVKDKEKKEHKQIGIALFRPRFEI